MMVMGLQRQQQILLFQRQRQARDDGFGGLSFVKVMTDDQIELLRKQIAVYAVISEQLLEMHKSLTAQQDLAGMRVGNVYCDPLMGFGGQKMSTRQRWTPAAVQLQVLESIFDEGNGTPCKQRIKDITMELSQHGPISETNVYNWFQNRRARSKRRHSGGPTPPNNAESVEEPQVESPKDKDSSHNSAPRAQNMYLQSPERGTQMEAHSGITSSTSLALVRVMPTPRFGNFRR